MSNDNLPLPEGWIRELDPSTQHPFWVDTKAKPPRSIWVHPYEDEQFLREHPDIRDRLARESPSDAPPPYSPRRHSYSGSSSGSRLNVPERNDAMRTSISQPGTPGVSQQNRGLFGKLKDKAIGTKEEREARRREDKRREEEYMRQLAEQRRLRQQAIERQRMSSPIGRYGSGYGPQYGAPYGQPMYAAPTSSPFGMGGMRRTGGFGGGIGMPLLAGAAGGLLLGDLLDGPGWGGGGFGGGGFGGGFDGGGFDGGGFDGGGGGF
ncbi:hypothetical protein L227DRAFT_571427 [Lentinus tigrinus ALCF2SS1-6]|uniref:WW domain-containing protein n=1 Tax=Lentinus tigrinus ALCF2SS1-6 TaxID=1328759 RepID=A0A5C2SMA7_9APHY|nr:hypothetical protein L227DRAFT_571427 [Lentinus tigrinus ALCF2SS1-6]